MAVPKKVSMAETELGVARARSNAKRQATPNDASPTPASNRPAPGLVGTRLRARRVAQGISLRQFARDLEVSASFISQLETGKAQPSVATLFSICDALGISTDELFAGDTTDESTDDAERPTDASNNSWRMIGDVASRQPRDGNHEARGPSPVVHPHERKVLVLDSGVTWESLVNSHHHNADFMFVRYDVGGSSTLENRLLRHVGTEYGFILKGTLEITVGFDTHVLEAGDSISYDSSRPHRLANVGSVPVEAIWMNLQFRTE